MTKFEKRKLISVIRFHKNWQQLTRRNARQHRTHMTCSVHFHRHDVLTVPLTVLLHCLITSMTRILSYKYSNRAGDNQSHSRIFVIVCHSSTFQIYLKFVPGPTQLCKHFELNIPLWIAYKTKGLDLEPLGYWRSSCQFNW